MVLGRSLRLSCHQPGNYGVGWSDRVILGLIITPALHARSGSRYPKARAG
jgi:hypothetical protein